jgi:hypothetical protein
MEKQETDRGAQNQEGAAPCVCVLLAEKSIKDISVKELPSSRYPQRYLLSALPGYFDLQQKIENEMLHELCGIIDGYRPNIKRKETPFLCCWR